jgi:PAS domain S-box-containing protein
VTVARAGCAIPLVVALILSSATSSAQSSQAPKKILVLHYYGSYLPSIQAFDQGVRDVIARSSPAEVDFYFEYLDLTRVTNDDEVTMRARHFREKYEEEGLSVVLAISDGALAFLRQHQLLPGVPIVASTTRRAAAGTAEPNVARIWDGLAAGETLALALRLHPSTRRVVVLTGTPRNDREYEREVEEQLEPFRKTVTIEYATDRPLNQIEALVSQLPPDALVLALRFAGNLQANRPGAEMAAAISKVSRVPLYTALSSLAGTGAVGGYITDFRKTGALVADYAVRVAEGTRVEDLPHVESMATPVFDLRQLRRWGISERQLPAHSVILFQEYSVLERYGWYIAAAVALTTVQGVMIGALAVQRSRRRQTEARHAAILRGLPDLTFVLSKDGVYLDYHAPSDDLLLVPPEHFLGHHMRDVLPPELADRLGTALKTALDSDEPVVVDYDMQIAGADRSYEARLVPCDDGKVLSVVREVTGRRQVEAALRESQERYALATAGGRVGVWDCNLDTGEVYVDPWLSALLGYTKEEIPDRAEAWGQRNHPDDRALVTARAQAHIRGETPYMEVEHRMMHKDGSIRWFMTRASVVHRDGRPVRLVGTGTDITDRKHAEHALQMAQADLDRMSRLAALGEFGASIAHEVSQPLTAITMNARACLRWLASSSPDLSEIRAVLWEVIESAQRADEVIRRNRALFRHHSVEKVALDINAVIREVAQLSRGRVQARSVALEITLSNDLPHVFGDRVELCQVLLNLIANGIDAMEHVEPRSRVLRITSARAGDDGVTVAVSDAGVGLAGVDADRMFNPAYTTKPEGTGVGLSISRSIIVAHGGRIWATQNQDRGATVSFTLPSELHERRGERPDQEIQPL